MGHNYLNGSIPKGLLNLPKLEMIELLDNYLSGSLPTKIAVTSKLGQLNLANNNLSGPFLKYTKHMCYFHIKSCEQDILVFFYVLLRW